MRPRASPYAYPVRNKTSNLPRPILSASHTTASVRLPAVSSDTIAPQNRDPTNWPCPQEFSPSPIQRSRGGRGKQTRRGEFTALEQRKLVAGAGFEPAIPPLRRDYGSEERRTPIR